MKLDPSIAKLLSIDPDETTVSSHGGGGMSSASTYKIETSSSYGSSPRRFFMKTGKGKEAEQMFTGEHSSLNAISSAVPTLCPHSYGHGTFANSPSTFFLVTDFMDLGRKTAGPTSSLATKLARLHSTPAPTPPGFSSPQFGFPVSTCCGDTLQPNTFTSTWQDFFSKNRLLFILDKCISSNGNDEKLSSLVHKTITQVIPHLLSPSRLNLGKPITPVVIHGDLWSGNKGIAHLPTMPSNVKEEIIFDPCCIHAHGEFELGIMKMFGGFSNSFWDEYHEMNPKMEPVQEWDDRVKLYEVYHHLNHFALFGGGYRSGAVRILEELITKYG